MLKSTRLLAVLLSSLCTAASWADVPFKATTITDGKLADDTRWYTIQLGAAGYYISDNDTQSYIALDSINTKLADADLWCFVGDNTAGYRLYNKAHGTDKVLAAPTTMSGTTGAESYPVLQTADSLPDGYTDLWVFSDSENLDAGGQYMAQQGNSANRVNNRDNKFAFWTGGADAGSTLMINFAKTTLTIDASTGTFTSSNAAGTWSSNWKHSDTDITLTLNSGYNNMTTSDGYIAGYVGNYSPQTYTLTTDATNIITDFSYTFSIANSGDAITVSSGDQSFTSSSEDQTLSVTGGADPTATFVLSGSNKGVVFKDFKVSISRLIENEWEYEVFPTLTTSDIPYRIPALAKASNGDLIAVADYRHCRGDIGAGKIDLRGRISHDNGNTWDDIFTIIEGGSVTNGFINTGFGDPAIVADRESNRVLMLSCSGNVMFTSATRDNHQAIARFYSEDNGKTWSTPDDISESIYTQFDNSAIGSPKSMFVGSGRILQSSTTKVGDYYRLYCSILYKDINGTNKNYVLYSDDFGGTWGVLGGIDVAPVPSGGDEPKTEEFPDGSILVSSRVGGGRYFNIFHFSDHEKAKGAWGSVAFSGSSNNGVAQQSSSCNGEALIVPAVRVSDNKQVWIAMQSLPTASTRARVGISYKELATLSDFSNSANYAKDWDGCKIVSKIGSAYSTLQLLNDSTVGVLYEEETHCGTGGGGYTIAYKKYSLEQITDSAYTYSATNDANAFVSSTIADVYSSEVEAHIGTNVGNISETSRNSIATAYETYVATPSRSTYEAYNGTVQGAETIQLTSHVKYRLRNYDRGTGNYYMLYDASKTYALSCATIDESNTGELFEFYPGATEGTWIIANEDAGIYFGSAPALYTAFPVVSTAAEAGEYKVVSTQSGLSYLQSTTPTNGSYPAVHLNGDLTKLVPWTTGSEASQWYIEPTDLVTAIDSVTAGAEAAQPETYYDLSGRRVKALTKGQIYVTDRRRKVVAQ